MASERVSRRGRAFSNDETEVLARQSIISLRVTDAKIPSKPVSQSGSLQIDHHHLLRESEYEDQDGGEGNGFHEELSDLTTSRRGSLAIEENNQQNNVETSQSHGEDDQLSCQKESLDSLHDEEDQREQNEETEGELGEHQDNNQQSSTFEAADEDDRLNSQQMKEVEIEYQSSQVNELADSSNQKEKAEKEEKQQKEDDEEEEEVDQKEIGGEKQVEVAIEHLCLEKERQVEEQVSASVELAKPASNSKLAVVDSLLPIKQQQLSQQPPTITQHPSSHQEAVVVSSPSNEESFRSILQSSIDKLQKIEGVKSPKQDDNKESALIGQTLTFLRRQQRRLEVSSSLSQQASQMNSLAKTGDSETRRLIVEIQKVFRHYAVSDQYSQQRAQNTFQEIAEISTSLSINGFFRLVREYELQSQQLSGAVLIETFNRNCTGKHLSYVQFFSVFVKIAENIQQQHLLDVDQQVHAVGKVLRIKKPVPTTKQKAKIIDKNNSILTWESLQKAPLSDLNQLKDFLKIQESDSDENQQRNLSKEATGKSPSRLNGVSSAVLPSLKGNSRDQSNEKRPFLQRNNLRIVIDAPGQFREKAHSSSPLRMPLITLNGGRNDSSRIFSKNQQQPPPSPSKLNNAIKKNTSQQLPMARQAAVEMFNASKVKVSKYSETKRAEAATLRAGYFLTKDKNDTKSPNLEIPIPSTVVNSASSFRSLVPIQQPQLPPPVVKQTNSMNPIRAIAVPQSFTKA